MDKGSKIVRLKYTHSHHEDNVWFEYKLMPYMLAASELSDTTYQLKVERYPYKWYSIKAIWEIPTYLLLRFSTKKTTQSINTHPYKIVFAIVSIISIMSAILTVLSFLDILKLF